MWPSLHQRGTETGLNGCPPPVYLARSGASQARGCLGSVLLTDRTFRFPWSLVAKARPLHCYGSG